MPGKVGTEYGAPPSGLLAKLETGGLNEALVWMANDNPARFFYEAMGARRAAERQERFAGVRLEEAAYAWGDLAAWLAQRSGEGRA